MRWISDTNALTTLSGAQYLETPDYKAHVENMLASYDHPTGILGELVSQVADTFWWVFYWTQKDQLLIKHMTDDLAYKHGDGDERKIAWLALREILSKVISNASLTGDEETLLAE